MESRVLELFQDIFDYNSINISVETSQDDVKDWDSIGHIRLILALEQEFNISIPLEAAVQLNNIKAIVKYLYEFLNK